MVQFEQVSWGSNGNDSEINILVLPWSSGIRSRWWALPPWWRQGQLLECQLVDFLVDFVGQRQDDHVMLHYLSMDVHKKGHPENVAPYARSLFKFSSQDCGNFIGIFFEWTPTFVRFCSHASKEKAKRHHRKSPHRPRKQKKHNYMCIYILYTYIIIYIVILNLYILFYICFL